MIKLIKKLLHIHRWKNYIDRNDKYNILPTQRCRCGIIRKYYGPMYGWERIDNRNQNEYR